MKVKTSVTLSAELLAAIDDSCGGSKRRSEFLEVAAWDVIRRRTREERDRRDREIYATFTPEEIAEAADFASEGVDIDMLGDAFSEDDFVTPSR